MDILAQVRKQLKLSGFNTHINHFLNNYIEQLKSINNNNQNAILIVRQKNITRNNNNDPLHTWYVISDYNEDNDTVKIDDVDNNTLDNLVQIINKFDDSTDPVFKYILPSHP